MTRQVMEAARSWGGNEAVERLLATLSPVCRARFSQPIGYFEWVESELALELHEAWSRIIGADTMAERGMDAALQTLQGPQGWLLRMASPSFLLENLPRVFPFWYRGGALRVHTSGQRHARIEMWAHGYPESWFQQALTSWLRLAMELSGARQVKVTPLCMDPASAPKALHLYEVAWEV